MIRSIPTYTYTYTMCQLILRGCLSCGFGEVHVDVQGYESPIFWAHNCLSTQKSQISGRVLMYIHQDIY